MEQIKKFVDLHAETEKLLEEDKLKEARQKYLEVVNAYNEIDKSDLDNNNKELAHDQLTELFKKVNEAKEKTQIPYNLIAAAILLITFSILVFFNPSIIGLATLEGKMSEPVDIYFSESGLKEITLIERPLSLSISGQYTGDAKLYYKQDTKLELIFDSTKHTDGTFTDVCEETCDTIAPSNNIELFAKLEPNSTLQITQIHYKIQTKENTPPKWTGNTRIYETTTQSQLILNLDEYFSDGENDLLTYLSTTDEGLTVTVQNNMVTITPQTIGTKHITLVASDLKEITRVQITIEVKENE